jgi:glycosyltransferase involved in cell wall biosynthesis
MPGVAVLTPFAAPSVGGNAVTVGRIARGLRERGLDVRVWDLSVTPVATVEAEVAAYRPEILHAFHAGRAGPVGVRLASRLALPLVVTLTGTDANHDLPDIARGAAVRAVLEAAATITAFHESIVGRVLEIAPSMRGQLVVVPQSVRLDGRTPFDLAERWAVPAERILFVFAAGIRAVKAPRRPLAALDAVAAADPRVRLLYAGPILEPAEGEALSKALGPRPWARHVGSVPFAQMASLLAQSDVVLNCSLSEGGMANSILEALVLERAVLVSDVPGNRALVEEGVTGLTFSDDRELAAGAQRLAEDAGLRRRLGQAGRALVEREYPVSRELDGYLDVYRRLGIAVASA